MRRRSTWQPAAGPAWEPWQVVITLTFLAIILAGATLILVYSWRPS